MTNDYDARQGNWIKIATPSLPFTWKPRASMELSLRMPNTFVRLMVTANDVALIGPQKRRWWQLWKPKTTTVTLAEAPHNGIHAGDTIKLERHGSQFVATINGQPILTYRGPGIPSRPGFGMKAGDANFSVRPFVSHPDGTVAP